MWSRFANIQHHVSTYGTYVSVNENGRFASTVTNLKEAQPQLLQLPREWKTTDVRMSLLLLHRKGRHFANTYVSMRRK